MYLCRFEIANRLDNTVAHPILQYGPYNGRSHDALIYQVSNLSRSLAPTLATGVLTQGRMQHWQSSPHQHGILTGTAGFLVTAAAPPLSLLEAAEETVEGGMLKLESWLGEVGGAQLCRDMSKRERTRSSLRRCVCFLLLGKRKLEAMDVVWFHVTEVGWEEGCEVPKFCATFRQGKWSLQGSWHVTWAWECCSVYY